MPLYRINVLTVLLMLSLFGVRAQRPKIDSLSLLLKGHLKQDTLRLNILNELAYTYYSVDPAVGVLRSTEALELGRKLNSQAGIATAYAYRGHNYSALGEDSLALASYDKAMEVRRDMGDLQGLARLIYNKGLVYFNESDYARANDNNRRAYEVFEKAKDSFLMAKMLNSIGINHMYLSQYPKALKSYLDAKRIYEDLGLTEDRQYASILSNIGLLYARLEKFGLAEEFQKKALLFFKKNDFQEGVANALTNLGRVYNDTGNPEKAIESYKQAHDIMEKNKNERGVASALTNMGIAYSEIGQYTEAIPYFEKTRKIYEKLKNANNLAIVHRHLGDCYALGVHKNLGRAEENYKASFQYAKGAGSVNLQFNALEQLASLQSEMGNYKGAYKNKTEAVVLRDSFASVEKKEEIALLEAEYEYEKEKSALQTAHDKKQAVSQMEMERQELMIGGLAVGAVLITVFFIVGFQLYKKREKMLSEKKISEFKTRVAETELKALRSQMNPHFIFNAMNSISDYMAKNDLETANVFLVKFSKLIRAILESSEKKWISLEEDLELMELYLQIETLRLKDKFGYSFHVGEQVDVENTMVPPLILQPFIENSIWHGVALKKTMGQIDVSIKCQNQFLVCTVDDDGVGRHKNTAAQNGKTSMGLKITKNRLDIINQLKKERGSIRVFDKKEGVRVELKLPLELQF
ncbi:Tetratricopeptide repeat-containing protein [Zobellia uliginosa]|uniref:Tetratricopeptide repeat-containing protein n=1 Tax=Zobellia uliginosa TaxID=143224 RepID=A0ABY1L0E9_9FLAO|nr:tetratricopeptide repeat protein [Zobellia uliginosa]SIS99007.1 Tetratricopeptide repeat-containing protein [Zobellia uliginosa]